MGYVYFPEEKEMNKTELKDFQESAEVFLYSAKSMLYYAWKSAKKEFHRFGHILWFVIWGIVYHKTQIDLFMYIGAGGALVYATAWMLGLNKVFEKNAT